MLFMVQGTHRQIFTWGPFSVGAAVCCQQAYVRQERKLFIRKAFLAFVGLLFVFTRRLC